MQFQSAQPYPPKCQFASQFLIILTWPQEEHIQLAIAVEQVATK